MDGQRNRARVLDAAESAFASSGTSASTEVIARAAGVGVGTVFRHFPTKNALLVAVFDRWVRRLVDRADVLAGQDRDAGDAFFAFCREFVDQTSTKNALNAALADAGVDASPELAEARSAFLAAVDRLLSRAQQAAAVRDDVNAAEALSIVYAASQAAERSGSGDASAALVASVVLDGLRHRPSK